MGDRYYNVIKGPMTNRSNSVESAIDQNVLITRDITQASTTYRHDCSSRLQFSCTFLCSYGL